MKITKQRFYYVRLAYQLLFPKFSVRLTFLMFFYLALPLTLITKYNLQGLYIWLGIIFVLTIIAYLRGFVVLSKRKDAPEENYHYLQQLDSKFYGISRKILYIETELFNEGYTSNKHYIVITSTVDKIYSIEHSMALPHAPQDKEELIKLEVLDQTNDDIKLKPIKLIEGKHRLFWQLNFLPCLPKDKTVKYSYTETTPKDSFAMTLEELKSRNMEYEYCSMRISYPTEHYKHKIIFPLDFDPIFYDYDVWLGEGRIQHPEEFNRLRQFWRVGREKDKRMFIEISVKHPIHGLIYALKWIPSSKKT